MGEQAREPLKFANADEAIVVTDGMLDTYHPRVFETSLKAILAERPPSVVLMANSTLGMDLGASVAAAIGLPMVAYATQIQLDGSQLVVLSQVYGGKLVAETVAPLSGTVISVIPGSWKAHEATGSPAITDWSPLDASDLDVVRVMEADRSGDVDITRADILVSVGRGIQDPENLELANELADAIGGVVSCSRPVVDAGWLARSRQVGKSGQTVKPKLYLALGISGAPEHLQGMKDSELIVAINNDANAPIFDVAHYGATVDILEFMPALTERLREEAG
jgi:electron transfer flavoprotein alpha subunit